MINLKKLKENKDWFQKKIEEKGVSINLDELLDIDKKRSELIIQVEELNRQKKEIASQKIESAKGKEVKEKQREIEESLKLIEKEYSDILYAIPSPAFDDVPVGGENKSQVIETKLAPAKLPFTPKSHEELGKSLNIIDLEAAAKVSGSRFYYLKGKGAELELALLNYAKDIILKNEFELIIPPVLVNTQSMWGMGYLEHGGNEETYFLEKDDLYLVGTAEQAIGPMFKDQTIAEKLLPIRYVGYSPSFRRESGSYGKDTKGIIRVHQFNKLEMFVFCTPEQSEKEHQNILRLEKILVEGLELPYQVVNIASGDLGLPAAKKYDIEVWFPSQDRYRETHSTSNTTDFQSRRLNIKYLDHSGQKEFVHTVNGTAFAFGRIIAAIMENFQTKDGEVIIPKVLQPYTGFGKIE